jgi:hypothetical protein
MRSSCLVFVTTASSAPSLRRFVSGHGFSRAANCRKRFGFSLCRLCAAAKAVLFYWLCSARLKSCPDTRRDEMALLL